MVQEHAVRTNLESYPLNTAEQAFQILQLESTCTKSSELCNVETDEYPVPLYVEDSTEKPDEMLQLERANSLEEGIAVNYPVPLEVKVIIQTSKEVNQIPSLSDSTSQQDEVNIEDPVLKRSCETLFASPESAADCFELAQVEPVLQGNYKLEGPASFASQDSVADSHEFPLVDQVASDDDSFIIPFSPEQSREKLVEMLQLDSTKSYDGQTDTLPLEVENIIKISQAVNLPQKNVCDRATQGKQEGEREQSLSNFSTGKHMNTGEPQNKERSYSKTGVKRKQTEMQQSDAKLKHFEEQIEKLAQKYQSAGAEDMVTLSDKLFSMGETEDAPDTNPWFDSDLIFINSDSNDNDEPFSALTMLNDSQPEKKIKLDHKIKEEQILEPDGNLKSNENKLKQRKRMVVKQKRVEDTSSSDSDTDPLNMLNESELRKKIKFGHNIKEDQVLDTDNNVNSKGNRRKLRKRMVVKQKRVEDTSSSDSDTNSYDDPDYDPRSQEPEESG